MNRSSNFDTTVNVEFSYTFELHKFDGIVPDVTIKVNGIELSQGGMVGRDDDGWDVDKINDIHATLSALLNDGTGTSAPVINAMLADADKVRAITSAHNEARHLYHVWVNCATAANKARKWETQRRYSQEARKAQSAWFTCVIAEGGV